MKAAEKRVIAAAMAIYRWHEDCGAAKIGIRRYKEFYKACAALSRSAKRRGK